MKAAVTQLGLQGPVTQLGLQGLIYWLFNLASVF